MMIDPLTLEGQDLRMFSMRELLSRGARSVILPPEYCTGYRWDILIFITFANVEGYRPHLALIAEKSRASHTTTIRCLQQLEKLGVIDRIDDPEDQRKQLFGLTPKGRDVLVKIKNKLDASNPDRH
jgi:DNA-binding HxlR family transcriptional regulator